MMSNHNSHNNNNNNSNGKSKAKQNATPSVEKTWSAEELQLLIKAVNLFPAGTAKR